MKLYFRTKKTSKSSDAFRLTRQHRRMIKNISVFSLRNSKTQSRVFRRHTTSKTRNVNDDDDNKIFLRTTLLSTLRLYILKELRWVSPFNPRRHRGGGGFSSGFPIITRERIGQSSRNLVYLSIELFYTFPENFKTVPTMTFDLWPDFQGHVKRNLSSVPFQRLILVNFGIVAGDMDMGRCCEVTFMAYTDTVTFPRSTEVNDLWWRSMPFFEFLCPRGNFGHWFWIWHPFIIHICRNSVIVVIKKP